MGKNVYSPKHYKEQTTPSNPPSGFRAIYAKSDGFYEKDDNGMETLLTNETKKFRLKEALSPGDLCRLINDGGIASMESIIEPSDFGAETTIENSISGFAGGVSASNLDDNKILLVYATTLGGVLKAVVGTVSGKSIAFGSVVQTAYNGSVISSVKVSTDKVFLNFRDWSNSNFGTGVIISVSGTVPTFNTKVVYNSALTNSGFCELINTDKVLIGYTTKLVVVSITGNAVSYGVIYTLSTGTSIGIGIISHEQDKAVIGVFNTVWVFRVISITGTAITGEGADNTFPYSVSGDFVISKLDVGRFISLYDRGAGSFGASICTISGNSISFGAEYVNPVDIFNARCFYIDDGKVMFMYREVGYFSILIEVVGSVINFGTSYNLELNSASNNLFNLCKSSNSKSCFFYPDTVTDDVYGRVYDMGYNKGGYSAICQTGGSTGDIGRFAMQGDVSRIHALPMPVDGDIMPILYIQSDGTLETTDAGLGSAGLQLSESDVLVHYNL